MVKEKIGVTQKNWLREKPPSTKLKIHLIKEYKRLPSGRLYTNHDALCGYSGQNVQLIRDFEKYELPEIEINNHRNNFCQKCLKKYE